MKSRKTEMVGEGEILSDLVQFATHQQITILQNNLQYRIHKELS